MKNWYALYCKPRTEKKAKERLIRDGWEVYCPLKIEVKQWSDRKKKVETPFFPSYIFVSLNNFEKQREQLLHDPALLNYVFWLGKPAVISEKEMNEVQDFINNYGNQNISSETWTLGSQLILGEGPFKGQEGVIKSVSNTKIVLIIKALGCQLVVNKKDLAENS